MRNIETRGVCTVVGSIEIGGVCGCCYQYDARIRGKIEACCARVPKGHATTGKRYVNSSVCIRVVSEAVSDPCYIVLALETLQEELSDIHGDRVRAEVESQRQLRAMEASFEKVVSERASDLSVLQRTHVATIQENEDLKQQLELERSTNRGLQSRERIEVRNDSAHDPLLGTLLDAVWQVTSDARQAFSVLHGAPFLLELIGNALGRISLAARNSSSSKLQTPLNTFDTSTLQHVPGMCGILVNMAATTEGRRAISETSRGELILMLLQLVDDIRTIESISNKIQLERKESNTEKFSRQAARVGPQGSTAQSERAPEVVSETKQLILCVISNLCAEKTIAIKLIKAGMVEKMVGVVKADKSEPLRRYAVNIVRSTLEFVQYVGAKDQVIPKSSNQAKMGGKTTVLSSDDIYVQIGDLITLLSKDSTMKMIGLELLGELQRVMPMED